MLLYFKFKSIYNTTNLIFIIKGDYKVGDDCMEKNLIMAAFMCFTLLSGCIETSNKNQVEAQAVITETNSNLITSKSVDIERLKANNSLFTDIILDYLDANTVVFHSSFGLFVCKLKDGNWYIAHSLDLEPIGATETQGDKYTEISSTSEYSLISPASYSPDNPNPATYRYTYDDESLIKEDKYEAFVNDMILWSNTSSEALKVQNKINEKLAKDNLIIATMPCPVKEFNSNVYGFITIGSNLSKIEDIKYGMYWDGLDKLVLYPLFND